MEVIHQKGMPSDVSVLHTLLLGVFGMKRGAFHCVSLALLSVFAMGQTVFASNAPPQAAAVGYTTNTFSSTFNKDVDINNTRSSGYNWYLSKFFGAHPTNPSTLHFNSDGSLTLTSGGDASNDAINSAADTGKPAPNDWVGTAFGGGGYFEAEFKFDPSFVMKPGAVGFPAWWLEPLEHLKKSGGSQWNGQSAGFEHFTEVDIFEYNQWKNHSPNVYAGTVHEWYGIHNATCPGKAFCHASNENNATTQFANNLITTPPGTDFRQYHRFGLLWVPATKNSVGYLQYYFDGKPTSDKVTWSQYDEQKHKPMMLRTSSPNTPWVFGVLDRQHLILILGTGNGQPMTVKAVNVWQKNGNQNLKQ